MSPNLILHECENRSIKLSFEGGRLRLRGPRPNLTPGLLSTVRQHRDALVELVARAKGRTTPGLLVHTGPAPPRPLVHIPNQCGPEAQTMWTTENKENLSLSLSLLVHMVHMVHNSS